MPWKESSVLEERLRFVARLLEGEPMSVISGFLPNAAGGRLRQFLYWFRV